MGVAVAENVLTGGIGVSLRPTRGVTLGVPEAVGVGELEVLVNTGDGGTVSVAVARAGTGVGVFVSASFRRTTPPPEVPATSGPLAPGAWPMLVITLPDDNVATGVQVVPLSALVYGSPFTTAYTAPMCVPTPAPSADTLVPLMPRDCRFCQWSPPSADRKMPDPAVPASSTLGWRDSCIAARIAGMPVRCHAFPPLVVREDPARSHRPFVSASKTWT